VRGEKQGSKSPFSLLSEPISPSSLLFEPICPSSLNVYLTFFYLLPTRSPYFSLLSTFFGPFLSPPYSVRSPPSYVLPDLGRILSSGIVEDREKGELFPENKMSVRQGIKY